MEVTSGVREKKLSPQKQQEKDANEERRLAEMMIPKKRKYLYQKVVHRKKTQAKEVRFNNTGNT